MAEQDEIKLEKPKSVALKYLKYTEIVRNKENPRLEFDLADLKNSIKEIGIIVPLIGYYDEDERKYVLLDGERRWRCVELLKKEGFDVDIPINIISKPTRLQNILEMFNIHNVRKDWGSMEIAWKLKDVMEETGIESERELARLTSLSAGEVRKSKILLSFDSKYQNLVHKGPKKGGVKSDFLIELKRPLNLLAKSSKKFDKSISNKLIDLSIDKYNESKIKNITDFRMLGKIIKNTVNDDKDVTNFIKDYQRSDYSIRDEFEKTVKSKLHLKNVENKVELLLLHLKELENTDIPKSLLKKLEKLHLLLENLIKKARK